MPGIIMHNVWNYRNLIVKLAVTDLLVRYKNSVLGFLWSLLQPMLMFIVLYLVFSNLFRNNSVQNYPLFLLFGIISWGFFEKATNFSMNSIVSKPMLVKKIYFPREILVISACLTALMMTALEFVVFGGFMILFGVIPGPLALLFPVLVVIEFFIALGVSLGIAALNVRYRDIQWMWAVILQAGFFMTPVIYPMSIIENMSYASILKLNPMGMLIEAMRCTLIYNTPVAYGNVLVTVVVAVIAVVAGWLIFARIEPTFAEDV